jgi:hypothetical protein
MDWLKGRIQAVFDHIVGGLALLGVVALVAAAGGAIVVWGGKSVAIEWWEIILLVAILIAIVGCLIVLFRRGAPNQPTREKGPHSYPLSRPEALEVDLARGPGYVGWAVRSAGSSAHLPGIPQAQKNPALAGLFSDAPGEIRTPDLRFRRPTLYPAELLAQSEPV